MGSTLFNIRAVSAEERAVLANKRAPETPQQIYFERLPTLSERLPIVPASFSDILLLHH